MQRAAEAVAPAERDGPAAERARLMPLLRELGHLKRITSAGREGSVATRLFLRAWAALLAGEEEAAVMARTAAAALAAAQLGDLDADTFAGLGLAPDQVRQCLRTAFEAVAAEVDPLLAAELRGALGATLDCALVPAFAIDLARQPRAGVTCPGKPRLVLQPAENHAEHSLMVALYGVLLAPGFGADPVDAFLLGLGHHFHNAAMPDSGFTGEMLLGDLLGPIIAQARLAALDDLPASLRARFGTLLEVIADDAVPEAQAFHAADAIDRVLEIEQHLLAAKLTMDVVLQDYQLVHEGPVKPFHDRVLREVGLL